MPPYLKVVIGLTLVAAFFLMLLWGIFSPIYSAIEDYKSRHNFENARSSMETGDVSVGLDTINKIK
jgi:hypothetical protein